MGDYKLPPDGVAGHGTTPPERVAHGRIRPFLNGNGRVGRLNVFKACRVTRSRPSSSRTTGVADHRGLARWDGERGGLRDACLSAQDPLRERPGCHRAPRPDRAWAGRPIAAQPRPTPPTHHTRPGVHRAEGEPGGRPSPVRSTRGRASGTEPSPTAHGTVKGREGDLCGAHAPRKQRYPRIRRASSSAARSRPMRSVESIRS